MRFNDAVFGVLFILSGAAIIVEAGTFPTIPGQPYGASFFPTLIGGFLAAIGAGLVFSGVRSLKTVPVLTLPGWAREPINIARFLLVIGALIIYIAVVDALGFLATAFGILVVLQVAFGVRLRTALVVAVVVCAAIQVVFGVLLRVPMPQGFVEALVL